MNKLTKTTLAGLAGFLSPFVATIFTCWLFGVEWRGNNHLAIYVLAFAVITSLFAMSFLPILPNCEDH